MLGQADLHETLARVWPQLKCEGEPRALVDYWFAAHSNVDRDVLALVRDWRGKDLKAFLATNQEHHRAHHVWEVMALKDHFDGMVYSAALGAAKPDALFFARAFEKLPAADSREVLFLDDAGANVEAAIAAGWNGWHYRGIDDLRAATESAAAAS
jgi:putative hydrolase of the HAD superfamily